MIKLSERAAQQFKEVVRSKALPDNTMLRVDAERAEGEGQVRLALRLDTNEPRPNDQVEVTAGAKLAVDKNLAQALGDSQIDYREESGGFVITRPEPIT